jgi:hypothetical protein
MKKIISIFLMTINTAFAYTQEDRISDMQKMATAMHDIQSGFFYNNFEMVKIGGATLADTIVKVEPPLSEVEEKDVMTRFMNNKVKMTNNIKKRIKKKAQTMIERFKDGDPDQALRNFTAIEKECMKCHVQLRKW